MQPLRSSTLIASCKRICAAYGEERSYLLGTIEQRLFVVVYTLRDDVLRIISARKANQRDVRHYENHTRED